MIHLIHLLKETVLKTEVDKLDINKLVNVPTGLNNLKTKVDDSDVNSLKTIPGGFTKIKLSSE